MTSAADLPIRNQLVDSFGRTHNNLRISVTDRCNLRCFYCMPEHDPEFMPRAELLTFEEIERVVRIGTTLGIDRVRLTGGEPLVRRELHKLVTAVVNVPGIRDVGLTTNGIFLVDQAKQLRDAGLTRLNVSLDALDATTFQKMTRRDSIEQVLAGIEAAKAAGFEPIKINAVSVRGLTEAQIVPFGELARRGDVEIRFIEFMPLDAENQWERDKVLFAHEIIAELESAFGPLDPLPGNDHRAPAAKYRFRDGKGTIGLIASVSQPFCGSCNRFRLTADGKLRNCLFSLEESDVRGLLRQGGTDSEIAAVMQSCIAAKREGHEINTSRFIQPERPMHSIGG
jgi:cyclic pyranopterin phosphate synthase